MAERFYVTTPIYYVNDVPHLGTAYTTIAADSLRRAHALMGFETRFLTGTDEHGLKLATVAKERGLEPQAFVDQMSAPFRAAWPELGIENDDFIRTTEARHKRFVQELWAKVEARGDLYEGAYEDWYCVGCESFKTEKELEEGLCPVHKKPAEKVKEETFFFRLAKYEKELLALYSERPEFIEPSTRRNEVVSFVSGGLRDLSVSRTSFSWGIPVPGHERHVMYVWFDALANYLSALGGEQGELGRFWAPNAKVVHLVGKDILRFHAVYWPAFLLAAGYTRAELPTTVFAHGFLTIDGQKMSKSLRNAVDPIRLAREVGRDALRWYLLRSVAFGQDGDFSHEALLTRRDADLGKNIGNLLSRTLGLCTKFFEGKTPPHHGNTALEDELEAAVAKEVATAEKAWRDLDPTRALEATAAVGQLANQYVDRAAPWATAKQGDMVRTATILAALLSVLERISVLLAPVCPGLSAEMRVQLGLAPLAPVPGENRWPHAAPRRGAGEALAPRGPLVPVLDDASKKALLEKLTPPREEAPAMTTEAQAPAAAPAAPAAPAEALPAIAYDDFAKVDLRVGLVVSAERVPKKDKLLKLAVDVGEPEPRGIVAGLALTFKPEDLVGKRVVVVANLAPRDFGKGLVSHGMLLASGPSENLRLATAPEDVVPGSKLK
jgi:methionyl-tRNA synthetase